MTFVYTCHIHFYILFLIFSLLLLFNLLKFSVFYIKSSYFSINTTTKYDDKLQVFGHTCMTQCKGRYRIVKCAVISSQIDECAVLFTMLT